MQECIYPTSRLPGPPPTSTTEDVKPVLLASGTAASPSASSAASLSSNLNQGDPHHYVATAAATAAPPHGHGYSPQSPPAQLCWGSGSSNNNSNAAYPSPAPSGAAYSADADAEVEMPESRERRLWELRLLHNQQTSMTQVFPTAQSDAVVRLWSHAMPALALRDGGALLHILLASSALNLWHRSASAAERARLMALQTGYLTMCFRAQRRDVACLSSRNADYVCFTSLKIVSHSVALVQTLSSDPWEPPLQWLHMGRGAHEIFRKGARLVNPDDGNQIITFLNSPPHLSEENTTLHDRGELEWLLDRPAGVGGEVGGEGEGWEEEEEEEEEDRELEDEAARTAYEGALSYTCSVRGAIGRGEPVFSIVRRLAAFSVFVPTGFVRLLAERRPRALVILAHFMALWLRYEDIWLIGKAGERQIRGIRMNLPPEWRHKLDGLPS